MLLQCAVALLLAFVLNYFYKQHNRHYLRLWSLSWLALSAYLLGGSLAESVFKLGSLSNSPLRILLAILTLSGGYLQVVLLLGGAYEIATGSPVSRKLLRSGLLLGVTLAISTSLIFIDRPEMSAQRFIIRVGLKCFLTGLGFLGGAYWVFYGWTNKRSLGRRLVGIAFVFYGLDQLNYFFLGFFSGAAYYTLALMMFDVLLQAAIGLGLVIWLQEEEHKQSLESSEELRASEDRYRNVVESQTEMVCRYFPDTTITFVNDAYCLYFGKTREELIGKKFIELAPPTAHESLRKMVDQLLSTRGVIEQESEAISPDGSVKWTQWFNYAIRSSDGDVVELQGVGRDISEQRQAENALRESEGLFRSLAENVNAGIFIYRDGRFIYANPAAESITGRDTSELLSMGVWELCEPENYDLIREKARARERGENMPTRYESSVKTKSGEDRYIDVTVDRISYQGKPAVLLTAFDITDRKKAEDALRESETRNRALLEAIPDILFLHSREGHYLDVYAANPLALVDKPEKLIGRKIENVLPEELARLSLDHFDKALSTGDVQIYDYTLELNGELRHYESRIVAFDKDRVLRIVRDITKRKHAEATVQRLASIIEESSEFIGLTSVDGRLLYLNKAGRKIAGLAEDEDINRRHTFELLAEEERDFIRKEVYPTMMRTGSWEGEFYLKHLVTGEKVAIQQHAFVIRDSVTGEPLTFAHISHDITERKRSDRLRDRLRSALEKSLGEWRLTFDAIEHPVLILDPEGRIRRLNRTAKEMLNGQKRELIGCVLEEFSEVQPWKQAAQMAISVRENRSSYSSQVRDDLNGRMWDISANFFVVPGVDDGVMLVARDITTMVDLQESLRRNETMASMGTLVAGVAHEVRNPLFGISATLDAFEARFGDRDDYRRYTSILRGEVERLNALMRGLLEFGKPHDLTLSKSSIKSLISRAVMACASIADKAKIQIVMDANEELPFCMVDAQRIIQVFQNVIENAVQHSPIEGIVSIKAEEIIRDGEVWIECEVKDSGPGFPKDDLAQVFKPFFTRRRGGTGLGLSIVQRIMQEHGGTVTALNESGGGATVKVRLKAIRE
jgi:PAS domain S-box-containing protein